MSNPSYQYKPKSLTKNDWQNLKRLFLTLLGIILILAFLYFFAVALLSNINNFWSIFRPGSGNTAIKKDRFPPPPPYLKNIPEATNEDTINISGLSEPGATVTLFLNDNEVGSVIVDGEGAFSFENIKLSEGENKLYAKVEDRAQNESKPSKVYLIMLDKEPPQLEIESPENGETIKRKEERVVEIKGKTEPEAQVTVNSFWARVDNDGTFSYKLRLEEGENSIKIVSKDKAGNETKQELKLTYSPEEGKD